MVFDNLAPQPPLLHPLAAAYAKQAVELSQAAAAITRHHMDIAYGSEERQQLDIYLPKNAGVTELPVLIFWHGGRWRAGYKEWNGFMAPALVEMPAILVSPSYGLSPDYHFPIPLYDCLAALAWVYRNIESYGGDPQCIFLGGHSAGGHLAALSALRRDLYPQFNLPDEIVKGCLPISGTMSLEFADIQPGSEEEQIQQILLTDTADAAAASPMHYAQGNNIPFLLAYGENDYPRVISSNKAMLDVLTTQPGEAEQLYCAANNHFQMHLMLQNAQHPWFADFKHFISY